MTHNIQESKNYILRELVNRGIKHEYSDFDSGYCMIDIWKADKFYVIQIEHESIGVSLVKEDFDLSTIPDKYFFDFEDFSEKLNEILTD